MKFQQISRSMARAGILAAALPLLAPACGSSETSIPEDPTPGATDFLAADGVAGQQAGRNDGGGGAAGEPAPSEDSDSGGEGGERTVEEGDIYRVLSGDVILNLNSYRGLQIIDFSDVGNPSIIGRLPVTGTPVEMYVVGDRAIILLNGWRGYYGQRDDVAVDMREGGMVMVVDISNRTNPVALSQAYVPGWISTSRLTRDDVSAALYVAASEYGEFVNADGQTEWGSRTVVKSFDVTGTEIQYRTELNLGGYVTAIQATPQVLLVARSSWNWNNQTSDISLIDISSSDGTMQEGDTVEVSGYVQTQFHMDFRENMLRVFSGSLWGETPTSHLQTWDASDLNALVPLDDETFGDGQNLYGAIFLQDSAFAVTYQRVDPFHAFAIAGDGQVTEMSEFVVSGWNDFFRPVLGNSRLVGIGINDANGGREVAVSLYDITNLSNPSPLIQRAEVSGIGGGWSWSEANWDHRAFSVLENAVNVTAPTGEAETGLVLLPFSGWNDQWNRYTSAVQIFTFSGTSLTARGVMEHGTPVRRSFLADDTTTANLSEAELSLYDHTNPNSPVERGRVELAPNYSEILTYGAYRARRKEASLPGWYYESGADVSATVEIIPASADPDRATPVTSIEVPAFARLFKADELLISVDMRVASYEEWPYEYNTTITVYDLTNPAQPVRRGELFTTELTPSYSYGGWYEDCFDCGYWGYESFSTINVVGDALTFLRSEQQQDILGNETVCSTYSQEYVDCWGQEGCTYISGGRTCRSLNGEPEICTGGFAECTYQENYEVTCEEVELSAIQDRVETYCYQQESIRYWNQFLIDVVDLSNPDQPALGNTVELPAADEGVSVLAEGDDLYVTVKRPAEVANDPRPYVRYFIKKIDFANPGQPDVGPGINVPGELVAVDGATVYTSHLAWGETVIETAVARLDIIGAAAHLRGYHRFADAQVDTVTIDDRGYALVSHRPVWLWYSPENSESSQELTILAPIANGFAVRSEFEVDSWATLRSVTANRALFQVPGGLLLINIENADSPVAQAYFPTPGWPSEFVIDGNKVLFAAGSYGVYEFDLNTFNLLSDQTP